MKKFILIYNPGAGQGRFMKYLNKILKRFQSASCEILLYKIEKAEDLDCFVLKNASDYNGIIVAGGDGTINIVLNCLITNNIKVPLGILPAGTANAFAKHMKLPSNFISNVDNIINGKVSPVDVGLFNNKYFINICSAGLLTNVSQKVNPGLKKRLGRLSYLIEALSQCLKFNSIELIIETPKTTIKTNALLFIVLNGSQVDVLEKLAIKASVHDGLLDILIFKACNKFSAFCLFVKVFLGKHLNDKNIIFLREDQIKINLLKGKCSQPDIDGEIAPSFPLDIKCLRGAIMMFVNSINGNIEN